VGPAHADEAEVRELSDTGRYGAALAATEGIADPGLRAEWRFHLLYAGGDLPGALGAAREGLDAAPWNPGLLSNAAHCATVLGLGAEALDFARRLAALPPPEGETPDAAAGREGRDRRLLKAAERVAALEAAGERGRRHARIVALGGLAASLAAMVLLARGTRTPRSSGGTAGRDAARPAG